MKVLFAVNNEKISDSIVKKYREEYKEIITAKNVYYFNAIIKELQKDKSYDRIVISEDLEPFANNNYETIDKFIFDKLDSISDEASNSVEGDIPIILICTDRRGKGESLLVKIFGIGVYSALLGQDRSIENVCKLINKPRTKKEAKLYYRIDSDEVEYKPESDEDVSETEIQNILTHYKRLGKNEAKYVESFDSIAAQYSDSQLKLIVRFLPLNVKAVLEANSPKYQQVMMGTKSVAVKNNQTSEMTKATSTVKPKEKKKNVKEQEQQLELIQKELSKSKLTKPVVIPSVVDTNNVRRVYTQPAIEVKPVEKRTAEPEISQKTKEVQAEEESTTLPGLDDMFEIPEPIEMESPLTEEMVVEEPQKKRRGRPRKTPIEDISVSQEPKRKRGRPRKIDVEEVKPEEELEEVNLFAIGETEEEDNNLGTILPGLEENEETIQEQYQPEVEEIKQEPVAVPPMYEDVPEYGEPAKQQVEPVAPLYTAPNSYQQPSYEPEVTNDLENIRSNSFGQADLSNLLTSDKKVVAFVGTSKNGTSFLVNNLAMLFSQKGIRTAILDVTKNRNAYYIYTENEENLRRIAFDCIENLRRGIATGIDVNKNLTVYTSLPEENDAIQDFQNILETLVKNYSVVLLDCDFETDYNYFAQAQEIYLVQTLDVLTIQPLTAFLRDLKSKNILEANKLRAVINKNIKVRSITEKTIIGGMAFYNDPAMSFMTELFNKDTIKYVTIPFEDQIYSKYLEGLVNCQISLSGYSKTFMESLTRLSNMVYPLINSSNNYGTNKNYNDYGKKKNKMKVQQENAPFSSNMNDTLDRMKRNF